MFFSFRGAFVSHCGRYVIVGARETHKNNTLYYCDLNSLSEGISGIEQINLIMRSNLVNTNMLKMNHWREYSVPVILVLTNNFNIFA